MVFWSTSSTSGIALRILGISQFSIFRARSGEVATVSYTHLTLPTILRV